MVQSLLAERFGLVLHFETQLRPVLALEVTKAGKLGPKLRPHSEGPPCPGDSIAGPVTDGAQNAFPAICGAYLVDVKASGNGIMRMGARDTTMELFAGMLPATGNSDTISLPVVDHTGLSGRFDLTMDFVPERGPSAPIGANAQPESDGPTILEALREQLGLKLDRRKVPDGFPSSIIWRDRAKIR